MRIGIEVEHKPRTSDYYSDRATTSYFLVLGTGDARQTFAVSEDELGRLRCLIDGVLAAYTAPRLANLNELFDAMNNPRQPAGPG